MDPACRIHDRRTNDGPGSPVFERGMLSLRQQFERQSLCTLTMRLSEDDLPERRRKRLDVEEAPQPFYRNRLLSWIPPLVVMVTSILLIIIPIWLQRGLEQERSRISAIAEPALSRVEVLVSRLGAESIAVNGYLLTRNRSFLNRYELSREEHQRLLGELDRFSEQLDPNVESAVRRLRKAVDSYEEANDRLLESRLDGSIYTQLLESQMAYEAALSAARGVTMSVIRFSRETRQRIQERQRRQTLNLVFLAVLVLLSGMIVTWLTRILRSVARQLDRRAEEEASFRQTASALTGAMEVDEVLFQITSSATEVTRADGVYVEKVVDERTVEVIATKGRGVPERGMNVEYPGSLTEEIIRERAPLLIHDMTTFGRAMVPYLEKSCENCQVLVVPLQADDEHLGALVLLNSRESGREFHPNDLNRAKILGDLASLALRRVRMIERERLAKEEAQRAARTREEVLGVVSHDLKNPLTTIRLSASLLASTETEEENRVLLQDIQDASERMQRLIRDLLDAARLEHAQIAVDRKPLDPNPLLRQVCRMYDQITRQRALQIDCDLHAHLPAIYADHDRILQVFDNLVGNAIKFSPDGERVSIRSTVEPDRVRFSVCDRGPGIRPEVRQRLFTRFWQASETAHMGSGLGLTIAKGIVEAHGGEIGADPGDDGVGSIFWFTVPRYASDGVGDSLSR